MQEDYIQFDRNKLKDAVHFICANCDTSELGNVKLHKILYFSDMMTFLTTGKPLTGEDYLKQRFGPTARRLSAVLRELEQEGRIRITSRDYFGYRKKDYVSLQLPDSKRLGNFTGLIKDVIDFVCAKSAKEISELSHDVAWEAAKMGERIPYAAALAFLPAEVTEQDVERATSEARRIRPLIEAERA